MIAGRLCCLRFALGFAAAMCPIELIASGEGWQAERDRSRIYLRTYRSPVEGTGQVGAPREEYQSREHGRHSSQGPGKVKREVRSRPGSGRVAVVGLAPPVPSDREEAALMGNGAGARSMDMQSGNRARPYVPPITWAQDFRSCSEKAQVVNPGLRRQVEMSMLTVGLAATYRASPDLYSAKDLRSAIDDEKSKVEMTMRTCDVVADQWPASARHIRRQ